MTSGGESLGNVPPERALVPLYSGGGKDLSVHFGGREITAAEFGFTDHSPQFLQAIYSRYWGLLSGSIGETVEVAEPSFIAEQVRQAERNGLLYFYMPEQYADIANLTKIAQMLPFLKNAYTDPNGPYHYTGENLTGTVQSEWFTVEWFLGTPLINMPTGLAIENLIKAEREGMNANVYGALSGFSKLTTNRFLDEGMHIVLPGTRDAGEPLVSTVRPETGVIIFDHLSQVGTGADPRIGMRSVGKGVNYITQSDNTKVRTGIHSLGDIDRAFNDFFRRIRRSF